MIGARSAPTRAVIPGAWRGVGDGFEEQLAGATEGVLADCLHDGPFPFALARVGEPAEAGSRRPWRPAREAMAARVGRLVHGAWWPAGPQAATSRGVTWLRHQSGRFGPIIIPGLGSKVSSSFGTSGLEASHRSQASTRATTSSGERPVAGTRGRDENRVVAAGELVVEEDERVALGVRWDNCGPPPDGHLDLCRVCGGQPDRTVAGCVGGCPGWVLAVGRERLWNGIWTPGFWVHAYSNRYPESPSYVLRTGRTPVGHK